MIAAGARLRPDLRFAATRRPFLIVAGVALVLSLIAPLTIDDPNADAAAVGTLIAMHVLTAAISVPGAAHGRR